MNCAYTDIGTVGILEILSGFVVVILAIIKGVQIFISKRPNKIGIFGIWLFFVSLGVLGSLTGVFFFNDTIVSPFTWNDINFAFSDLIKLFTDPFTATVGMISMYLLVIIPALAVIFFSLKMIFRFKVQNRAKSCNWNYRNYTLVGKLNDRSGCRFQNRL